MRRLFGGVCHEGWGEEGYPEIGPVGRSWGCLLAGMTGGQAGKTGQGGEGRGEGGGGSIVLMFGLPLFYRRGAERTWG